MSIGPVWDYVRWGSLAGVDVIRPDGSRAAIGVFEAITPGMNSVQINAVLDRVFNAGGGIVYAMPGNYTGLTQPFTGAGYILRVRDRVRLLGAGPGTFFRMADSVSANVYTILLQGADIEVGHLRIDGNRARYGGGYQGEDDVVQGANTVRAYIHDLTIFNAGDSAIDLDQSTDALVQHNYLFDCNGNGVHLAGIAGGNGARVFNNRIVNCGHVRHAGGGANAAGIDFFGIQGVLSGNRITDCYRGIVVGTLAGPSNHYVTNNHIDNPGALMVQGISGDANTYAIGNTVLGAITTGINACGFVAQNRIDGGVQNVNCTAAGARVLDNVLTGATSQSVLIDSASITFGRVAGNQMTRDGTKVACNSGSGVVIEHNHFFGTGTAIAGAAVGSMTVRTNP